MAWTPIAKPTAGVWTDVNPQGKEQYDQVSITYDDSNTFYDGVNPNQWTSVAKPATNAWVTVAKPT